MGQTLCSYDIGFEKKRLNNLAKKAVQRAPCVTLEKGDDLFGSDVLQTCAICLTFPEVQDTVRILPCRHCFHKLCIDPWLLEHRTCPMCKLDIVKHYGMLGKAKRLKKRQRRRMRDEVAIESALEMQWYQEYQEQQYRQRSLESGGTPSSSSNSTPVVHIELPVSFQVQQAIRRSPTVQIHPVPNHHSPNGNGETAAANALAPVELTTLSVSCSGRQPECKHVAIQCIVEI